MNTDRNRVLGLIGLNAERPQLSQHDLKLLSADEISLALAQGQLRDMLTEKPDPSEPRRNAVFSATDHPNF